MRRLAAALAVLALVIAATPAGAVQYYLLLGSRVAGFEHYPLICAGGRDFISLSVLDELGLAAAGGATGRNPHSRTGHEELQIDQPDAQGTGEATEISLLPPAAIVPAQAGEFQRYRLATHTVDVSPPGNALSVRIDGVAVPAAELKEYDGGRYLALARLEQLGFTLVYNPLEGLYQLVGEIYRVDYEGDASSLVLRSLTPLSIAGKQEADDRVTFTVQGGYFADSAPRDFANAPLDRLGFKSQPELGRSYLFVHQPRRTGFRVACDPRLGFSRITFGNFLQVASYAKTSSGEISLNVQLGAPVAARHELLADPWRLVIDFPGAQYVDATQTISVGVGRVERIRAGSPEPGTVRVVLDLSERADYRVLTKDDGARYYIQLLPPVAFSATPLERRTGRTIMVDAGHGGSDPGAQGVLPGVWEAPINMKVSEALAGELRCLGYDVLMTRTADRFVSLGARADYANSALPYLFVSVHSNSIESADFTGVMTFHHPVSLTGPRLAKVVHEELLRTTGATDKGVRQADFFVLRETVVPAILIECGFLTNKDECALLNSAAYQQLLAKGIAAGIDRYVTGF